MPVPTPSGVPADHPAEPHPPLGTRPLGRGGLRVGPCSLGAAQLGNLAREVPDAEWSGALPAAWRNGVRYVDVAPHYGLGLAERRLGTVLAGLPRDAAIVSTKVGRLLRPADTGGAGGTDPEGFAVPATHVRVRDYSRDGVLRSLEASLDRLGLDRVDILYVHDPDEHYREAMEGAFPALDELRSQGVIRSYGAGMNQSAMLTRFVRDTDLDVVLLAGRYTLLEQGPLDDLLPECARRGVSVVAAGAFNSGLLADAHPPQDATYDYQAAPPGLLERARAMAAVCARHGTTLPAAAARFPLGHPAVASVCIGAYSAEQAARNAALFREPVGAALWSDLVEQGLLRADAPVPAADTGADAPGREPGAHGRPGPTRTTATNGDRT
ncbi:D-threo-aldose 1-dehydrogenase [Murinocardiopsis flavida]|uniref:D-threo-aldose 1-dehydrogenase n=1 Tax=Murinocardiopsis flavida TaxID=645275 RepID=A0A2P8DFD7_9ACTN|nr:aldo/keto reductase [Murinocardiopsis flavida]PSK95931.1 D-threo-aldose 1-dehydrogenase [Murinocardiopsis flavida]